MKLDNSLKFVADHLEQLDVVKHNLESAFNVFKQAEKDFPEPVAIHRQSAEKLDEQLSTSRQAIVDAAMKTQGDFVATASGQVVAKEDYEKHADDLFAAMEASKAVAESVMALISDIGADPALRGTISAEISLPHGLTQVPPNMSLPLAMTNRQELTLLDAQQIVEYIMKNSSSAALTRIAREFFMSVVEAATKGNMNQRVKTAATFTPGKARIAGNNEYTFGLRWVFSCVLSSSQDPNDMVSSTAFLTVSERGLLHRIYFKGSEVKEKLFEDFIPDSADPVTAH